MSSCCSLQWFPEDVEVPSAPQPHFAHPGQFSISMLHLLCVLATVSSAVSPLLAQLCRQRWEEKASEVNDSRSRMEGRTSSKLLLPKGHGCGKAACYNGSA